jgi:hypothetical protein
MPTLHFDDVELSRTGEALDGVVVSETRVMGNPDDGVAAEHGVQASLPTLRVDHDSDGADSIASELLVADSLVADPLVAEASEESAMVDTQERTAVMPPILSGETPADGRMVQAWREWLGALARDAEAAHAAAMAYKALDPVGREIWIEALKDDAEKVGVPRIAVYAPLLAVEGDPSRRERIEEAIGPSEQSAVPSTQLRALSGTGERGLRVGVILLPLNLDFVQVLACGFRPGERFEWVRHDPIVASQDAVRALDTLEGVLLERTPVKAVLDELASMIVTQARGDEGIPEALHLLSDLLVPSLDGVDECAPLSVAG